jgi:RimJ/RimL family protein N-acetyltransferase
VTPGPVPPAVLPGPRLDLVLVTVEQLLARAESDGSVPLGYADPEDVLHPDRSPLRYRVRQVSADPAVNPWLLRIAVLRATGEIVGLVNFHAPPDADGMVEIGYRVLPAYRRRGYAREMAGTMWDYAASHPDVRVLRATFAPDNAGSRAIIEGAGFVHVGEQDDPEDGLELVYEIRAADYRTHVTGGVAASGSGKRPHHQ